MPEQRDYLTEALRIVRGETAMLAQREHLLALYAELERLQREPRGWR